MDYTEIPPALSNSKAAASAIRNMVGNQGNGALGDLALPELREADASEGRALRTRRSEVGAGVLRIAAARYGEGSREMEM